MIHIDEYRLARIVLTQPARYDATTIEIRALNQLVQTYDYGEKIDPEMMEIARHLMRGIADEAAEGTAGSI